MTIGELARRSGLAPSAIRYYEAERLIPDPARQSGRRVYDERTLARLAVIQLARHTGFTLAETRELVSEFGRLRWRRMAQRKREEIARTTAHLRAMADLLEKLLDCECPDLEFCGRVLRKHAAAELEQWTAPRRAAHPRAGRT
jgi:MerR family transcriptional regulator, redox-sensitive transcriptional activator SoxR